MAELEFCACDGKDSSSATARIKNDVNFLLIIEFLKWNININRN